MTETADRRQTDTVVNLLRDRMDAAEAQTQRNADALTRHIVECSATNKRVLIGLVFVGTWIVAHSPEAMKVGKVLFPYLVP